MNHGTRNSKGLWQPPDQVGEKGAREKVLTVGRPPKRQAGKVVVDEGEGGKQIAEFLAEIKVI